MLQSLRLVSFLALGSLALPAHAEPAPFTGTIELSFSSGPTPIEWVVPIAGVADRAGAVGYAINDPISVTFSTSSRVFGSISNPLTGGGAFSTGRVQTFVVHPGFIALTGGGSLFGGLDLAVHSLALEGATSGSADVTFNHASVHLGRSSPITWTGGSLVTPAGATPATLANQPWSTTLMSLGTTGGDFNVVTPIAITAGSGKGTLVGQARIALHFLPEPGTGALLVCGAGLLVALGRRRARPRLSPASPVRAGSSAG